jgi:putative redox protein
MPNVPAVRDLDSLQAQVAPGSVAVMPAGAGPLELLLLDGRHVLVADEPIAAGGGDAGPGPYELLLMALGACTCLTVKLYAARKSWPLEDVQVRLRHDRIYEQDCANCQSASAKVDHIGVSLRLVGPLSDEQRGRLLEIAEKCPVHRTLTSRIRIRTELDPG